MAQKTPLPALTVMYADRWNSTWFVDLENFRTQLMHDYHLRFLLTGFLRLKKQWLYLLSIHKSGGFYFFKVITLTSVSNSKYKPLLEPKDENKQKLVNINKFLNKSKIFQNNVFNILKKRQEPHWKKRISYKKAFVWSKLTNDSVVFKHGYYNHLDKKYILKNKNNNNNFMSWQDWMKLNRNKIAVTYYNPFLVKFFYKPKTMYNVLSKPQNLKTFNTKITTKITTKINTKFSNKPFINPMKKETFKRKFSTSSFLVPPDPNKKKINKQSTYLFQNLYTQDAYLLKHLYKKKVLMKNLAYRLSYAINKKHLSFYKMLYRMASYFYRRMFRYKKYSTIKVGYNMLYKKYGHRLKYTHVVRRLSSSMLMICRALNRVTAMQNYMYYLPLTWEKNNYKILKRAVVFERYVHQKSFVASVALLHLALSRGSANLVIDLLLRKLRRAFLHVPFLSAVEHICRFFMAPYEGNTAFKYSLCKGMDLIFKGKVNGSDRAKTWRFKFGPVHTSTFYTNTREQVAKCVTRYGVFNIKVRLKLGAIVNE
jgi:hypothetical protein